MWGLAVAPAMQAIHLGYPIGALLAPMTAVPFVSTEEDETGSSESNSTSNTQAYCSASVYGAPNTFPVCVHEAEADDSEDERYLDSFPDNSTIGIAFAICGIFSLTICVLHLVMLMLKSRNMSENPVRDQATEQSKMSFREIISPNYWSANRTKFGLSVYTLLVLFYICHIGSTYCIMLYLVSYLVESQGFTSQEAAWLQTAVSLSATLARAASILITQRVSVNKMVISLWTNFAKYG